MIKKNIECCHSNLQKVKWGNNIYILRLNIYLRKHHEFEMLFQSFDRSTYMKSKHALNQFRSDQYLHVGDVEDTNSQPAVPK